MQMKACNGLWQGQRREGGCRNKRIAPVAEVDLNNVEPMSFGTLMQERNKSPVSARCIYSVWHRGARTWHKLANDGGCEFPLGVS